MSQQCGCPTFDDFWAGLLLVAFHTRSVCVRELDCKIKKKKNDSRNIQCAGEDIVLPKSVTHMLKESEWPVGSGKEKNSSPGSMSKCLIELLKDSCGRNESE